MKRTLLLAAGFFLVVNGLGAQQTGDPGKNVQTVDEAYLHKNDVQVAQIQRLGERTDRDSKLNALDIVGEMITKEMGADDQSKKHDTLSLAQDDRLMNALADLGREGVGSQVRENNRLVNDYPDVRAKAAAYLGIIKGDRAREILLGMIQGEREPMVLAEVVYSLGLVGADDKGRSEVAIANVVKTQDMVRPDNNLAYASISAIRQIGENKGANKVQPDLFDALIRIAQGNYIHSVRVAAKTAMEDFRKNFKSDDKK